MKNKNRITITSVSLTVLLAIAACGGRATGAEQWAVFESSFASTTKYENPFTEVKVDVVFTQGENQWKVPAFWAGDKKWTVRFAPPTQGKFTYRVECTDKANPDLNGKEQTLSVAAYKGDNPLLKHGFLRVAEDVKRRLKEAETFIKEHQDAAMSKAPHN